MSKYGRNKKRKHLEEIKILKNKVEYLLNKVEYIQSENVKINREVNQTLSYLRKVFATIEEITKHSILLPAKEVKGDIRRESLNVRTYEKMKNFCACPTNAIENIKANYVTVHELKTFIEKRAEDFSRVIHLRYVHGKESCYMISHSALKAMPVEDLVKEISPALIHRLKESLEQRQNLKE